MSAVGGSSLANDIQSEKEDIGLLSVAIESNQMALEQSKGVVNNAVLDIARSNKEHIVSIHFNFIYKFLDITLLLRMKHE